jgi:hypothetical protein
LITDGRTPRSLLFLWKLLLPPIAADANWRQFTNDDHLTLVRGGTDLVTVAEMLGHARLDTVRAYNRPTAEDRAKALNLLPTGR